MPVRDEFACDEDPLTYTVTVLCQGAIEVETDYAWEDEANAITRYETWVDQYPDCDVMLCGNGTAERVYRAPQPTPDWPVPTDEQMAQVATAYVMADRLGHPDDPAWVGPLGGTARYDTLAALACGFCDDGECDRDALIDRLDDVLTQIQVGLTTMALGLSAADAVAALRQEAQDRDAADITRAIQEVAKS